VLLKKPLGMSNNNIMINPQIEDSRKKILRDEFQKPYFAEIKNFLQKEKSE
jgi:hypothetical protein